MTMIVNSTPFSSFLTEHCQTHHIAEDLFSVVQSIVLGCLNISDKVRLGNLAGVLGEAGSSNVQGESQKKLDVLSNSILQEALRQNQAVAGFASEEEDEFVTLHEDGNYLVLFDPLDGSSNIDINISVGTIFSVLLRPTALGVRSTLQEVDFLQSGRNQLVAGYVLYGTQTQLVITFGHGVYIFTLDNKGQFILTRENIQLAYDTAEFAINMSNYRHWEEPVRQYIDELLAGQTGIRQKNYNMRWVASMVAEVHRILMRGGVFLYPKDARNPDRAGKLRLMYEANPMSLLIEQAGGQSINAVKAILDIQPTSLHERVAVILGATEEVSHVLKLHQH